ncbi:MAG TPA: hypothetical protein VIN08_19875 [Ohtaekwangia sp.]|uniref:hypothetical protein n=1 Tax=Ohtaekwangia sp. TaxID=2066019 RepID=UPI002F9590E9
MPEIRHQLGILDPTQSKIYSSLTACMPLTKWLTPGVTGHPNLNTSFQLSFGAPPLTLQVTKVQSGWIQWHCTAGDAEWINTTIDFTFDTTGYTTVLNFVHSNWQEGSFTLPEWSFNWALYLRSLKKYCENGTGYPYPNQIG